MAGDYAGVLLGGGLTLVGTTATLIVQARLSLQTTKRNHAFELRKARHDKIWTAKVDAYRSIIVQLYEAQRSLLTASYGYEVAAIPNYDLPDDVEAYMNAGFRKIGDARRTVSENRIFLSDSFVARFEAFMEADQKGYIAFDDQGNTCRRVGSLRSSLPELELIATKEIDPDS